MKVSKAELRALLDGLQAVRAELQALREELRPGSPSGKPAPRGDAERLLAELTPGPAASTVLRKRLGWKKPQLYSAARILCESGRIEVSKRPGKPSVYRTLESSRAGEA